MKLRLASALVLVLGVAVFAGSALAGNGQGNGSANGNGNGNGNAAAADASAGDSSPGNSGNAPGQLKKEAEAALAVPATPEAAVVVAEAEPANSEGVKPSNTTQKDTHEAASSNKTKVYGNGKTAGQIAIANGAAASTILHGPGNSQPHKAAGCAGGHEVDVHALKGKGHLKGCGSSSPPVGPTPGGNPGSTSNPHVAGDPTPVASSLVAEPATTPPADPGTSQPSAGVASGSAEQDSHGVLAAASVVAHGALPFTGVQLWAVVLFALMLVGSGLALRRQGAPVETNDR